MIDLPKYVMSDKDRHGNVRYYYRRGKRKVRLRTDPGTEAFLAEYVEASDQKKVLMRTRRESSPSVIYFIRYGRQRVKIGTTSDLNSRYGAIRKGVPGKASILYVTPGDITLERELHRLFAEDRVTGEWFIYSTAIREWIAADMRRRWVARTRKDVS